MASTQLSDIIDVTVFQDLEPVNSPEKSDFVQSGIVVSSELLDGRADAPGNSTELPFWKDLDGDEEVNYSNDDPDDDAAPEKVDQGEQVARKAFVNKGWSATSLATELASSIDPIQHVRNRADTYFMRQWQRRVLAACAGVMADNVANDNADMVIDVASESIAGQSASTLFSRQNFINASYTLGDMVGEVSAMAVHSNVMKQMSEQGDVEDVLDADGNLLYQSYMGKRLIMDDQMTAIAGTTDGVKYTSILFGPGAFGFGNGTPTRPVAIDLDESAANGAGVEELWVRNTWILHPFGFQQTGTPAATSFTLAELRTAAVWDRVVERKNVPLAFLVTN
jgi:hypothetical protein